MSQNNHSEKQEGAVSVNSQTSDVPAIEYDAVTEKKLVRKTDVLLLPGLCLAYFAHTLDRANLGNAKTDGIEADLGMIGNQFNLLLVLFYVTYALCNVPWTLAAKKWNASVIIPLAVLGWGACTMGAAGTTNFGGILTTRIFMGFFEAAYKPCEVYYLSLFYTRKEIGLRNAWTGQMGFLAGAVSGLISWGVFSWNKELHGWQYLFIIEGAITVGIAAYLYIFAPRSPEKSRFYTAEEARLAKYRLELDAQDIDKQFRWFDAKAQLRQGSTWAFAFMALMYGVGTASSSNFLPTIIKRLTKKATTANLYTVGPNLTASVMQLTTVWLSDRYQQRALFACGATAIALVAWILLGALDLVNHTEVGYFLTFLTTSFTFVSSNLVPVWLTTNTPTTTGRAVSLGLNFMAMNAAGVVSSLVFRAEDAPVYAPALITVGCTQAAFVVAAVFLRQYYARLNKKLDSGEWAHAPGMAARPEYRYAV